MFISPQDREKERSFFEAEKKRIPDQFLRDPMVDDDACLRSIGIEGVYDQRPIGYLKLFPQDFVVEEISKDSIVRTIDLGDDTKLIDGDGGTYYADLVKIGISTLDAKEELAHALNIDEKNIGYAGIKDKLALTAQAISIRGIKDPQKISEVYFDSFFLKNIARGKGVMTNGDLGGNRFTITLRLVDPITPSIKAELEQKVLDAKQDGFWNFFYLQRFGTPRLISHKLGRLLLLGDYEGTVKLFLTYAAEKETPYFSAIRTEIMNMWGDWHFIDSVIGTLPSQFNVELVLVRWLMAHPNDFLGALRAVPDQVRLWIYAYASFLFNKKLSELIQLGDVPLWLPILTSYDPNDWKPYAKFLEEDGIRLPSKAYKDFSFVYVNSRRCPTLQPVDIHGTAFEDRTAVFSFSLPKGSYATSFLMSFFTLASGLPIVPGIFTGQVDGGALLGRESFTPILERFKTALDRHDNDLEGSVEE
jgi:tRNA pseudouridine13 synthase